MTKWQPVMDTMSLMAACGTALPAIQNFAPASGMRSRANELSIVWRNRLPFMANLPSCDNTPSALALG